MNQPKFRKLANGKIVKTVEEQYIRQDVPCGLCDCPVCDRNFSCRLKFEDLRSQDAEMVSADDDNEVDFINTGDSPGCNGVFIVDHWFLQDHIDMVENCDTLRNVVISDSILKHLNKS